MMHQIEKICTVGGMFTLFVLSMVVPPAITLTAVQLSLAGIAGLVTYRHFGEEILAFVNHLKGEGDGQSETTSARESRGKARTAEPTVAAADAATEGERDPA